MSTIEFSAGFMAGLPQRVIRANEQVGDGSIARCGLLPVGVDAWQNVEGRIYLMQGTMPTNLTFTNTNDFVANSLCRWSGAQGHFSTTQTNVNPAIITSVYAPAYRAGTATWFLLVCCNAYVGGDAEGRPIEQMIAGTVGLKGSGADLEIPSTDIIVGNQYRVVNLRVQFPSTWTY